MIEHVAADWHLFDRSFLPFFTFCLPVAWTTFDLSYEFFFFSPAVRNKEFLIMLRRTLVCGFETVGSAGACNVSFELLCINQ